MMTQPRHMAGEGMRLDINWASVPLFLVPAITVALGTA